MTVLDDVLTELHSRFAAAVGDVPVYDGPDPAAVAEGAPDAVFIGTDGEALVEDGDDTDGITVTTVLSEMGPGTWRDETGEVVCAVWSWTGDEDIVARRERAEELARACAATVYADRTLGVLDAGGLADVTEFRYRLRHTTRGALARVAFTVTYSALIT